MSGKTSRKQQAKKQQAKKQQAKKQHMIKHFDPGGVGLDNGNIFGFPFDYETADIVIFGVPWEVTVSFHGGTAQGPQAVLAASPQLDFYDYDYPEGWQQGIYMPPVPEWILQENEKLRSPAEDVVRATEKGEKPDSALLEAVNEGCRRLNEWLFERVQSALDDGKKVGVVGGDHSVPLGALRAIAQKHSSFGILHIDAHCDLREAYQGFEFSHASIMRNVLKLPQVSALVQVGIRDVSAREIAFAQADERVVVHHDMGLKRSCYAGASWYTLCQRIVADLPEKVYVSFDIDGLDPKLCPATGTPVPGGLELDEAFCLLREVADTREIIGFDLCEVGADEWDGNVGARIVYKLCNLMGLSRK